jgi:NADPH-dependent curcumin reductase CurA
VNRAWIVDRPVVGNYSSDCLRLVDAAEPVPADGDVLVRTLVISIDPTTRNWLTLDPKKQFLPFGIGDQVLTANVGVVLASRRDGYETGDLVRGHWGMAELGVPIPFTLERLVDDVPIETQLSTFSHVGRAAAVGLLWAAELRGGDDVVVSGAAGATGSIAVQIAKSRGHRVIAIAGGAAKTAYCRSIGADETIDYRSDDVAARLAELAPDGVDVYFDNVGGPILDAVLQQMAVGCRIAICGVMSQYQVERPEDAYGVRHLANMLWKRASIRGFVVPDAGEELLAEYDALLRELYRSGAVSARSHVIDGLEAAADAIGINYAGENEGKLMVRVAGRGSEEKRP